jgi:hypothetical protein
MHWGVWQVPGQAMRRSTLSGATDPPIPSTHPTPYPLHPTPYTLLHRNVERFQGELVFKAHRLMYHSTLGLRPIKQKRVDPGRP